MRWCSDIFEIHCFNGEKVYACLIVDCHDRECIAYLDRERSLLVRDIQELMLRAVEVRFWYVRVPLGIQFLKDRGEVYRSLETCSLADIWV